MANDLSAFMATMVAPARCTSIERVVRLVGERYGLEVSALRLTGERDENFKLSAADGAEYVLKIASPAEAPAVTELPVAALLHLESVDPTFPCPRVRRSRTGESCIRFTDETGGEPHGEEREEARHHRAEASAQKGEERHRGRRAQADDEVETGAEHERE